MALCSKCANYDKKYADLRRRYEDVVKIGGNKQEKDFCSMYEDFIPLNITYEDADCPFFFQKEDVNEQS